MENDGKTSIHKINGNFRLRTTSKNNKRYRIDTMNGKKQSEEKKQQNQITRESTDNDDITTIQIAIFVTIADNLNSC